MDEANPPAAQPEADPVGLSRRWVLAGGAALVAGAAAGAIVELISADGPAVPPLPPAALLAAVRAERRLIADLDATTGGAPGARQVIVQARADHAAHLEALTAVLRGFRPIRTDRPTRGRPRTLAQLHEAEATAARDAAHRAEQLSGATATLLASIAACEASHAELLR
jgi:hypothetical protein